MLVASDGARNIGSNLAGASIHAWAAPRRQQPVLGCRRSTLALVQVAKLNEKHPSTRAMLRRLEKIYQTDKS
jgi:hypothetical protein